MRRVGAAVAVLALGLQTSEAAACVLEPLVLHRSDATLARIDTSAPEAPVVVAAEAYRRSGLTCGQDVCVANNCGDLGGVAIDLAAGQDDQTPANRLGYRLELVAGELPDEIQRLVGVHLAGPTPLRLHLAFDEVPAVDATLRVIALDAAGNESGPSAPFEIGFDGCTLAATGDQCEGEYDADADYAARGAAALDETASTDLQGPPAAPPAVERFSSSGGCALAPGGSAPAAPGWGFAALAALLGGVACRRAAWRAAAQLASIR